MKRAQNRKTRNILYRIVACRKKEISRVKCGGDPDATGTFDRFVASAEGHRILRRCLGF